MSDERIRTLVEASLRGEGGSSHELKELIYDHLKQVAKAQKRRYGCGRARRTTSIVHEAFLRLAGRDFSWQGRPQFFALAATVMREVLVDHARIENAKKRGGSGRGRDGTRWIHVGIPQVLSVDYDVDQILDIDAALTELAARYPRAAKLVELKFFGGLSHPDIAEVLGSSVRTVEREWGVARGLLGTRLDDYGSE